MVPEERDSSWFFSLCFVGRRGRRLTLGGSCAGPLEEGAKPSIGPITETLIGRNFLCFGDRRENLRGQEAVPPSPPTRSFRPGHGRQSGCMAVTPPAHGMMVAQVYRGPRVFRITRPDRAEGSLTIRETAHSHGDLPSASAGVLSAGPRDVPVVVRAEQDSASVCPG